MVRKKPIIVIKPAPKPSAHDFTLKRDEWERAVFLNADHFTVVVFINKLRYRADFASLKEAIATASEYKRSLLYAVTEQGRSTLLPPGKWPEFLKEWENKNG